MSDGMCKPWSSIQTICTETLIKNKAIRWNNTVKSTAERAPKPLANCSANLTLIWGIRTFQRPDRACWISSASSGSSTPGPFVFSRFSSAHSREWPILLSYVPCHYCNHHYLHFVFASVQISMVASPLCTPFMCSPTTGESLLVVTSVHSSEEV